ncbi:MAG: hypothetical protein HC768_13130 [Acaryochloris sp. CRU_2_0]|nr:hypothetical protein [Acaryochloris sp. CRU_2_0]
MTQHHRKQLRRWRRRLVGGLLSLLVLMVALPVYSFKIEPFWLQVTPVSLTLPHLDTEFNGYRIVQLSDLQIVVQTRVGM